MILGYLFNEIFIETPIKVMRLDTNTTIAEVKKIRILCFLHTMPKTHSTRAVHVKRTWGRYCDKLLFSSTLTDINLGAIGFNVTNDHSSMWGKVKLMMQHIHEHFINDYDWFIKGDDDMFLIPQNLRFMLSGYSTEDPIYFGCKFNTTDHKWGYFSGGSGYVMSRQTVRIFVEKVLTNKKFFHGNSNKGCHIETDARVEDWDISVCLDLYNVYAGDSRDLLKRDRFLPFSPEGHLFNKPGPWWYWQRKYYWSDEGLDCCSNYTVSFHYIAPRYQYSLYFFTYRLQKYGVKLRFPPPPKKNNFTNVTHILDLERVNKTLRGY